jgi:hypothetical protein
MTFGGATTRFTGPRNETSDLSIDSQSLAWAALASFFSAGRLSSLFYTKGLFFQLFVASQKVVVVICELPTCVRSGFKLTRIET